MPTAATITVNDRETSPVAHNFLWDGPAPGSTVWNFKEPGTAPIGDAYLALSSRKLGTKYKVRMLLSVPVVATQTINGVSSPLILRKGYADVTFTFEDTSTLQERKNLVGMFANSLASSQTVVDGVVTKLERISG